MGSLRPRATGPLPARYAQTSFPPPDLPSAPALSAIPRPQAPLSGSQAYGQLLLIPEDQDSGERCSAPQAHPSGDHNTRWIPYSAHWNVPATRRSAGNRTAHPDVLSYNEQAPEPAHLPCSCQKRHDTRYHSDRRAGQNPCSFPGSRRSAARRFLRMCPPCWKAAQKAVFLLPHMFSASGSVSPRRALRRRPPASVTGTEMSPYPEFPRQDLPCPHGPHPRRRSRSGSTRPLHAAPAILRNAHQIRTRGQAFRQPFP